MPENKSTELSSQRPMREENSHEMSILLQKVLGADNTPNFTEKQVDELLAQKREITGFIHEDKKRESRDGKFYLTSVLAFILLFSGLVMWKKPDLFSEVLSFLVGVFGGSLGGYGLASRIK